MQIGTFMFVALSISTYALSLVTVRLGAALFPSLPEMKPLLKKQCIVFISLLCLNCCSKQTKSLDENVSVCALLIIRK